MVERESRAHLVEEVVQMSLLFREQSLDILHLYATRAARRLVSAPFASRLGPHGPRGAAIIVSDPKLAWRCFSFRASALACHWQVPPSRVTNIIATTRPRDA